MVKKSILTCTVKVSKNTRDKLNELANEQHTDVNSIISQKFGFIEPGEKKI